MVGEFRALNPKAKISMVAPSGKAMSGWSGTARMKTDSYLKKLDVTVIADRCERQEPSLDPVTITLASETQVEADLYIPLFGRAQAGFIGASIAGATEKWTGHHQ